MTQQDKDKWARLEAQVTEGLTREQLIRPSQLRQEAEDAKIHAGQIKAAQDRFGADNVTPVGVGGWVRVTRRT